MSEIEVKTYSGIRITSDYLDCAMPIALDSRNLCSYRCLYCFANFIAGHADREPVWRALPPRRVAKLLERKDGLEAYFIGKRQPLQLGALTEPFDRMEGHVGNTREMLQAINEHDRYPCRISTKGGPALDDPEYLKLISEGNYWFTFSIITNDDADIKVMDAGAPDVTTRLRQMKAVADAGARVTLRLRPFIPGFSKGIDELMARSQEAGAEAISFEVLFFDDTSPADVKKLYYRLEKLAGRRLYAEINKASPVRQRCLRANRAYKAPLVWPIYQQARKLGLRFCISDPIFKELNDTPCCCGMPEDDPVWGNFSRHGYHVPLIKARRHYQETGERAEVHWSDFATPDLEALGSKRLQDMVFFISSGPIKRDHWERYTIIDDVREKWNNTAHARGVYVYFDGILEPVAVDGDKNVVYRYDPSKEIERFV